MNIQWVKKNQLFKELQKHLQTANVILDIGCGIRPQKLFLPEVHIYADPYLPYLQTLKNRFNEQADRKQIFLHASWAEIAHIFTDNSVDSIFLLDVIEHLPKEEGKELLIQTEKIARKQVIIFTPLGYLPQSHPDGKDNWGMDGGSWQEHKSGWLPEDFDDDYHILACHNFHEIYDQNNLTTISHGAMWAIYSKAGDS